MSVHERFLSTSKVQESDKVIDKSFLGAYQLPVYPQFDG